MFEELKKKYAGSTKIVGKQPTTTQTNSLGVPVTKQPTFEQSQVNKLGLPNTDLFAKEKATENIRKFVENNTPTSVKTYRTKDAIKKEISSARYQMNTLMGKTDYVSTSKKKALQSKIAELEQEYKNAYGTTINPDEQIINASKDITYTIGALGNGVVQGVAHIPEWIATTQGFVSDKTTDVLNYITGQDKKVTTPFTTIKNASKYVANTAGNNIQGAVENASNPVAKKVVELSGAIGNMAPGIAMNVIAPGSGLGTAAFMISAGGAYLDDAEQRGLTGGKKLAYASIMGALEGATERLGLGKVGKAMQSVSNKLIGKALTEIGAGAGINAIQEAVIEPLSEITSQTLGGEYDYSNMGKRMLEAGIDGALVYLMLGGMGAGFTKVTGIGEKVVSGENVTQQEINEAIEEMKKGGVDVTGIQEGFNETVNNINNQLNNEQTIKEKPNNDYNIDQKGNYYDGWMENNRKNKKSQRKMATIAQCR